MPENWLQTLFGGAVEIGKEAIKKNNNGPAKTAVATPVNSQAWLPFAIIGGAVVLVFGLVLAFKR